MYVYIYGVLESFRSKSSKCSTRLLWPCHLVKPPYATGHNRHFQKLPVEFVDSKEILLLESTSNAGYKNITAFLTRLFEIVNPGTLRIHTFQAPSPSRGCTIELRWSWEFALKKQPVSSKILITLDITRYGDMVMLRCSPGLAGLNVD